MDVNPKLTLAKLKRGALKTSQGRGSAPLPGVKTDAKHAATADMTDPNSPFYGATHCDPQGYWKNRELADRISAAVQGIPQRKNGPFRRQYMPMCTHISWPPAPQPTSWCKKMGAWRLGEGTWPGTGWLAYNKV